MLDGKWVFEENVMPDVKRISLTRTTEGGSILVNLTLAEEIRSPTLTKFELNFMNPATRMSLNDVEYEIVYDIATQPLQSEQGFLDGSERVKFFYSAF